MAAPGRDGLAEVVDPSAKIGEVAPADLAGLVADLYVNGGRYSPLAESAARSTAAGAKSNREDSISRQTTSIDATASGTV